MQEKTSVFSEFSLKNHKPEELSGVEAAAEDASVETAEEAIPVLK